MNNYDVVVVGSGLGGLCCGVILAKEGLKVCVVEQDAQVGGCLRSFERRGRKFDTGMHYFGSMDEGQILRHFFRYAGVEERLHVRRLDVEAYDRVLMDGEEYRFAQGYEAFEEGLAEHFPCERADIHRYTQALRQVGEVIGVENLKRGVISTGGLELLSLSASSEIDRLIAHPQLRKVVASTNFLYDGIRDHSPFYTHAMINHSFINGAYRFVDGSQQLADALAEVIRGCGSEVRCRAEVRRIHHQNNEIQSVELASGERLMTRSVVSDIHPRELMKMIDEGSKIRTSYVRRINDLENSFGIFSLYAVVDREKFPYRNCNYYITDPQGVWGDCERQRIPQTVMMSMQAQEAGDSEIVSLLTPCRAEEFAAWTNTSVGHRGAEYEEWKSRKAEEMIDRVEEYLGGLKSAIREVYTASPLTYRDYTGVAEGSAYGIMNDCERPLETMLSPLTKLHGLYLTGQNVNNHGALGVLMTSIATCGEMLGVDYVCRKIGNL